MPAQSDGEAAAAVTSQLPPRASLRGRIGHYDAGLPRGGRDLKREGSEKHLRLANALRDSVARHPDGSPDWLKAQPYVRRYLAIHATEGGTLDDLVSDPLFLVAAEPAGLKVVMAQCSSESARRWAACKLREFSLAEKQLLPGRTRSVVCSGVDWTLRCRLASLMGRPTT